ncbi:MAG TPA: mycofactocin-coupled SDR family oxidoreductase [Nocardioides sp.]|uniref:mycofactocin-coupled SDR family oxidoreductase n=1 Tax=uncultured Nocardioides sp. TaxID=198441 RepID=UPI000EE64516|nr:mycofactocin-coupled SDR family oxidoreductase [uncultured Nocardioides sp.]HCB06229.1 SDR family mycofactocin-dependent oxidoreductase [Nocardioides sp.]HRD59610.1 mycofactocin-coupled SDR family oxidoreductase [Nocardioides sp.]HRI94231.1 mycofactocin-coupled SDR family oxidoreductase [Nocardioides sp.]HRK44316.1 mycofactocin-coupled SDR family oxidoreductase [Nocardioides sp.]
MGGEPRFDDQVVVVTGAARGQGRRHAVRFAELGADVVAIDLCDQVPTVGYPMSTPEDLAQTVAEVESLGRRCSAYRTDVRDLAALLEVARSVEEVHGRVDAIIANAGICITAPAWEMTDEEWDAVLDTNLTGVWNTVKAFVPLVVAPGRGGSVTLISSLAGLRGIRNAIGYISAKHALTGLMRSLANELAPYEIRVNSVNPTNVATPMLLNSNTYQRFNPDLEAPTVEDTIDGFSSLNLLPVPWVEPDDVSDAVLWLASEEGRYVTGAVLPVDAGGFVRT